MRVFGPETPGETVSPTVRTLLTCTTCSRSFSFEEGEHLATLRGIRDHVVICPQCASIFEVNVTSQGVTVAGNVTLRYGTSVAPAADLPSTSRATPDPNILKLMIVEFLALGFAVGATQVGGGLPMVAIGGVAVLMALLGLYVWRRM